MQGYNFIKKREKSEKNVISHRNWKFNGLRFRKIKVKRVYYSTLTPMSRIDTFTSLSFFYVVAVFFLNNMSILIGGGSRVHISFDKFQFFQKAENKKNSRKWHKELKLRYFGQLRWCYKILTLAVEGKLEDKRPRGLPLNTWMTTEVKDWTTCLLALVPVKLLTKTCGVSLLVNHCIGGEAPRLPSSVYNLTRPKREHMTYAMSNTSTNSSTAVRRLNPINRPNTPPKFEVIM